jgi:Flp pilus assembly CpaE family ATPase
MAVLTALTKEHTMHPTAEEIDHVMQLTGMDYIQARNHIIGAQSARQLNRMTQRQRFERAAMDLADSVLAKDADQHRGSIVLQASAVRVLGSQL